MSFIKVTNSHFISLYIYTIEKIIKMCNKSEKLIFIVRFTVEGLQNTNLYHANIMEERCQCMAYIIAGSVYMYSNILTLIIGSIQFLSINVISASVPDT